MLMSARGRTRRWVQAVVLGCAVIALLVATARLGDGDEAAAQSAQPNIVVVMTDDQDVRSVRVMDAVRSQLAGRGTTFVNSFASFPLCCPSRATFLTGQYAHNHGVRDNVPPAGGYSAFADSGTLPVSLLAAGYRTALIGKYLNGYDTTEVPPGWSQWQALIRSTNRMYGYTINENGRSQTYGTGPGDYQTDVLARKAAAFVGNAAAGAKPFFLVLSTGAPHHEGEVRAGVPNPRPAPRHSDRFATAPLPRPPSYNEVDLSDKPSFVRSQPLIFGEAREKLLARYRGRLGSLLAVDDAVERLLTRLREAGELTNTVVIFTSDNGFMLGEHRLTLKTKLYDESARVPLVMRGPGIPPNVRRTQIAANIDLAPTILELANAEPQRVMDGRSLLPLAQSASVATDREILLENQTSTAVRTPGYMYAEHPGGEAELYDLGADPFQLESRHDDPALASTRELLQRRLHELADCAGETCR
jgi:arylsulfatase A-like enzyme